MEIFKTEEHPEIATILSQLALIHEKSGQTQKSIELYQRVYGYTIKKNKIAFIYCFENLAIKEKIHGTKFHLDVAETLSSLAYLYEDLEDFDEALKYCQLVYGKIYLFLLKLNKNFY